MPDHDRWPPGGGDPSLNDINRIDRFIDALATNQRAYSTDHDEAELAFLLADWRDGVRDAPLAAVVTPADAAAALHASTSSRRHTRSLALVGSVAAAVICLGGFGTAVYGANPGDTLYGVRSMLFGGQQKTRDDQVTLASAELAQVQQLVDKGDWQGAQDKLVALSSTVQNVGAPEDKHDLTEQYNALTYKVIQQDPAATLPPPGEPLPPLPPSSALTLLPVPVVVEPTTTSSATTTSESTVQEPNPASTTTSTSTTPTSTTSDTSTSTSTATSDSTTTTTQPSTATTSAPSPTTPSSATSTQPPSSAGSTTTTTTTTTTVVREAPSSSVAASASVSVPPSVAAPPPSRVVSIPSSAPAVQSQEVEPAQPAKPSEPAAVPRSQPHDVPEVVLPTTTMPRSAGGGG